MRVPNGVATGQVRGLVLKSLGPLGTMKVCAKYHGSPSNIQYLQ